MMSSGLVDPGSRGRNAFRRSFLFYLLAASAVSLPSCASVPRLQPEINNLVVTHQWSAALDKIGQEKADYGRGNYLLYYLDRGMVEQMNGRHEQSIRSFEKAKRRFEELYTQSLSKEAASWTVNDYALPYRGSDYEYVLVNIFQALNYVQLGQADEALVEARDLDSKFSVVEERARNARRGHFEDNGFARLFMGLVYEAAGRGQDLNDAWIAYRQALALYDGYYGGRYVPSLLQERLLALAARFSDPDLGELERRFPHMVGQARKGLEGKAVVYLVHCVGYSPVKVEEVLPVPLNDGFVTKVAVPRFARRPYAVRGSRLVAGPAAGSGARVVDSELGADIEDIAQRDLESRRALTLSKAVLRPGLKYLVERKQKENVRKKYGDGAAEALTVVSDIYNLFTEKADLRSWQSLPAQIRIARMVLEPGPYRLKVHELGEGGELVSTEDLGDLEMAAGETRFFLRRAYR